MNLVTSSPYTHMIKFVKGIRNDYDALVNGILLKASNGKIEGKINKLKKIKRDMYGRCSFGLLKGKFFFGRKSTYVNKSHFYLDIYTAFNQSTKSIFQTYFLGFQILIYAFKPPPVRDSRIKLLVKRGGGVTIF
jgi:hypothetical protein